MAPTYPRRNALERDAAGEPCVLVIVDGRPARVWFEGGDPVWVAPALPGSRFLGSDVQDVAADSIADRAVDAAIRFINAIKGECA
jgi:hypothetical protein